MHDPALPPDSEHPADAVLFALAEVASPPATGSGWARLDDRGLLEVSGPDAEAFLQGQLTQDLARVRDGHALLAAHCTPKGRISTLFRAWPAADGFLLECPASMQAAAARRLRMYVLRAKVTITEVTAQWQSLAVFGPQAATWLAAIGLQAAAAASAGTLIRQDGHLVLALPGARWQVLSPPPAGEALHSALAAQAGLAPDPTGWALACLRQGEPEVFPGSAEAFIPQMLNLDQLDGISFRKGCYTGQEIVARSHYLGKVKRRMQHLAWRGSVLPQPGQSLPLASPAAGAEAVQQGEVVLALQTHAEGGEVLAVVRVAEERDPAAGATV